MYGAGGSTKDEIKRGLKYSDSHSDDAIADNYREFSINAKNGDELKIGEQYKFSTDQSCYYLFPSIS
jgi:hypothetical protein